MSSRGRHLQREANKRNDCQAQLHDNTESSDTVRAGITTRKVAPNVRTMPVLGWVRMVAILIKVVMYMWVCPHSYEMCMLYECTYIILYYVLLLGKTKDF